MRAVAKVLAVLVGIVALLVGGVMVTGTRALSKRVDIPPHALDDTKSDPVEGQRLANLYACTLCHGGSLGGSDFLQGMPLADLPAPNLTGKRFSAAELEGAIRHGVGADGRPLMIMPARAFAHLSDQDVASIVAYVQSIGSVQSTLMARRIGPVGRIVAAFQADELLTTRTIDHDAPHTPATPSLDGAYLTGICRFCHGEDLGGSIFAGEVPMWAPNLTSHATGTQAWNFERFAAAVTKGVSARGTPIDPDHMPWQAFAAFTDAELRAVWDYTRVVPAIERPIPARFQAGLPAPTENP